MYKNLISYFISVTNVWTADDRKNGRGGQAKPIIRAASPITQQQTTLNNNAVKAYRGTPAAQNNPGGSPLFHHERSRRGFQTSSTSIVSSGPDGKYTPLHNDASNAQRLLKNGRNSTAREMFLTLDEKMNVSFPRGFFKA